MTVPKSWEKYERICEIAYKSTTEIGKSQTKLYPLKIRCTHKVKSYQQKIQKYDNHVNKISRIRCEGIVRGRI